MMSYYVTKQVNYWPSASALGTRLWETSQNVPQEATTLLGATRLIDVFSTFFPAGLLSIVKLHTAVKLMIKWPSIRMLIGLQPNNAVGWSATGKDALTYMTAFIPGEQADERAFLDSVEGEISFFRSIMRARPVGMHRHFHVLTVRNAIQHDTGRSLHVETIWEKLKTCYNLDALETIELESEGYGSPKSDITPVSIRSPSPSGNLVVHPFFKQEFTLPYEDFESIIAQRRLRSTVSLPSSPAPSSPAPSAKPISTRSSVDAGGRATSVPGGGATAPMAGSSKRTGAGARGKRKMTKSKLNLAGLVGGDSDSSALTQESGDEGGPTAETPMESVVTGTDVGTEYGEDEDVEMREASPAREASPRPKGRTTKGGDKSRRGRGGTARGGSTRGKKKQKR